MTVKELITCLKMAPQDYPVWMTSDPEGNEVRPLDEITDGTDGNGKRILLWPKEKPLD